jgi:uroporphyrinogen-III decarboxylase
MSEMYEINSAFHMSALADPGIQELLLKLVEAGREYQRMNHIMGSFQGIPAANGYPSNFDGLATRAPFDILGDSLRGTSAIMKDMYRRPDKVLEACDKIADLTINTILKSPMAANFFKVSYPLHKGADGWMSKKQFDTFYWPTLKKVMDALIKEGFIQNLFAEGSFNSRIEFINEFPIGSVIWWFDQSDIFKAKKLLGDKCTIMGNIPASLTATGSPSDVKAYCRKLIEGCGQGGGYVLSYGCCPANPKLENLRAMLEAVKEFGVYRK